MEEEVVLGRYDKITSPPAQPVVFRENTVQQEYTNGELQEIASQLRDAQDVAQEARKQQVKQASADVVSKISTVPDKPYYAPPKSMINVGGLLLFVIVLLLFGVQKPKGSNVTRLSAFAQVLNPTNSVGIKGVVYN